MISDETPCPCCKTKDFEIFEDKRLRRSLNALKVGCTNKKMGCPWEGELGQLGEHLNAIQTDSSPLQASTAAQEQLRGCRYVDVSCTYCSNVFKRSALQSHQSSECPNRPTVCMYCDKYCSNNEDVTTKHWSLCAYYPVRCSNECGKILQRQDLAIHIASTCPLSEIDCDFMEVGCKTKLLRKDMSDHSSESVLSHLSLMARGHSKLHTTVTEQENVIKDLTQKTERLEDWVAVLNQSLETMKQDTAVLQNKLRKRDERLTQHVTALQQQLAEETRKSRRENTKLMKMVKQHMVEERKTDQSLSSFHHKFPFPAMMVFVVLGVIFLYALLHPLKSQDNLNNSHSRTCVLSLPVNYSMNCNFSIPTNDNMKWYSLTCTRECEMCIGIWMNGNRTDQQQKQFSIFIQQVPDQHTEFVQEVPEGCGNTNNGKIKCFDCEFISKQSVEDAREQ